MAAKTDDARSEWIRNALAMKRREGKTQAGLAAALGLDQSQGFRIASGKRPLKLAELPLVERYLGVRAPRGIIENAEQLSDGARPFAGPGGETGGYEDADGFISVPVYEQRISAGGSAAAIEGAPVSTLKFREDFLRRVSNDIRQLYVLEIAGDSNLPNLHSGDHALVDPGQINPAREGRYVIRIDDELQVKLVSMNPSTRLLTVKADNPDYPGFDNIRPGEIAIVGRVVWIGRDLT